MKHVLVALTLAAALTSQSASDVFTPGQNQQISGSPAYHDHAPTEPLPDTLAPLSFKENRNAFVAYTLASRVKPVLYQVPCYCGCDREQGHSSLLDCFTGNHGIRCHMCQREVIFCYLRNKQGAPVSQIRKDLAEGKASRLDVEKYTARLFGEIRSKR
jgi:hypothetical protein